MKKAEYQKKFSLTTELVLKPNSRQMKSLKKSAEKEEMSITEYANIALTKSLKEEA